MTKLRNKIVLVLLALCLAVCAGLFVACGGDDNKNDANVTYTVTVNKDGAPVKGVKVTVKKGTLTYAPKTTGDNGKAEFKLVKSDDYTVELSDLPENYESPAASFTFPADRNLTVNLAEKFAYKVKLVKENGDPFTADGVSVGICTFAGNCLEGVAIDENGVARIGADKGDYHIRIDGLPAGYAYESDSDGYSVYRNEEGLYVYEGSDDTHNCLSETVTEKEITIYQVNALDLANMTAMTDAQIAEYNDQSRTITGAKAYKVQATVPGESTVYYSFTAEYSGKYRLYAIGYDASIVSYRINPRFLLGDTVASGSGWFNAYGQEIDAVKGNRYYINITAQAAQLELEYILTTPEASRDAITGATTVKATINKEGANAIIALTPTAGASYKVTLQGEGAIKYSLTESEMEEATFADADYKANAECAVKFTEDLVSLGYTVYFAVSVKGEYPATIDVKVEKIANLTNTFNNKTTMETLDTYDAPEGTELIPVPLDGTAELVLGDDGYYHYGAADGPVVMVILTKALDSARFGGGVVAYIEYYTNNMVNPYVVDVTSSTDRDDLTKGKTFDDYRELLRGFKDYKYDSQNNARVPDPDDITVEKYYAKYVNDDGACPLTADLKNVLQIITNQILANENVSILPAADNENVWMFACYYYDVPQEADPIVGDYSTEDGAYTLSVTNNNQFVIMEVGEDEEYEYASGTWSKNGDAYTFTVPNDVFETVITYANGEFTLTDVFNEDPLVFKRAGQSETDAIVGDYSTADGAFVFTISNDNQFTVMEVDVGEYTSGTWSKNGDTYTFTIPNDVFETVITYSDGELTLSDVYTEEPLVFTRVEQAETDEIVGEYAPDEMNPNQDHLIVDADGTYSWGTASGTWSKNADDDYYTFNNAAGQPQYTADFTGESVLLFAYGDDPSDFDNWPVAELFVVEEEEDDGDPDFADLYSDETLPQDPAIAQARLGLYNDGKCVLWQFDFRTQTYAKIATATWGAEEDGSNVTISGITVVEGYEYEITANYAQGVVTVTLHMDGVDEDTVYTFDMTQQA